MPRFGKYLRDFPELTAHEGQQLLQGSSRATKDVSPGIVHLRGCNTGPLCRGLSSGAPNPCTPLVLIEPICRRAKPRRSRLLVDELQSALASTPRPPGKILLCASCRYGESKIAPNQIEISTNFHRARPFVSNRKRTKRHPAHATTRLWHGAMHSRRSMSVVQRLSGGIINDQCLGMAPAELFGGAAVPSGHRGTYTVTARQLACVFVTPCSRSGRKQHCVGNDIELAITGA